MKLRDLFLGGAVLAVAATLGTTGAMAGTIVIGGPGNGSNCFPFGCPLWAPQYQQVYASGDFAGTTTIQDLVFYHTITLGGAALTGNFTIDLSATAAPVNGLNLVTLSDNIGTHDVVVYNGALPSILGSELIIPLSTPYTYDPALGNLLMDINGSGLSGGGASLDADDGGAGGAFSRAMTPGCCAQFSDWGLVTGFTTSASTTSVPEPLTLSLFGTGLAGAIAMRRRKKKIA